MIGLDFVVNVSAGAALLGLGFAARRAIDAIRTRHERRMWRSFRRDCDLNIAVTTRPGPLPRSTTRASLSEVKVLVRLIPILTKLKIRHYLIDSSVGNMARAGECNLLVLGGPATNELAREALKILEPHLPADFVLSSLAVVVSNRRYAPEYDPSSSSVIKDYGLVIRAHNPFTSDRSRSAILIMGCHGFGTAGAAQVLNSESLTRSLLKQVQKKPFLAIVSATITGSDFNVELKEVYPLVNL